MSPTSAVLACTGLTRSFGALRAVDRVDLAVAPGARHALIGPNGAGKSTLFQLLAGGLRPTAGQIWLDGREVTRLSDARRARRGVGQTFQHASVFPSLSAADNVALAAERALGAPWRPVPRGRGALQSQIRSRIDELLADVDLIERRDHAVAALSHGERRQLELAIALAAAPRVILLDEPAAGLSPGESERLAALLLRLPAGLTLLFVEHDLDLVFRVATGVTVLHLGRVLVSGSPDEVRGSAEVQQAYLGTGQRADLFLDEPAAAGGGAPPEAGGDGAPAGSR